MVTNHNKRDIVLIERVQRGFTKSVLYNMNLSYKERLLHLGLLPLSYRREICDLLFFFKCINGLYDVDANSSIRVSNNARLRSGNSVLIFNQVICNTVTFQSSYIPRTIRLWNSLPRVIRQCSDFVQFRKEVKLFYKNRLESTFDPDVHATCIWVSNCRCASRRSSTVV